MGRQHGEWGAVEGRYATGALLAVLVLGLGACGGTPGDWAPGQDRFVSAPAQGGGNDYAADGPEAGRGEDDQAGDPQADRTVEEADVVRAEGTWLYVLNAWRGLQVLDMARPDAPELVGTFPVRGRPVEMYVRGDQAFLVVANQYLYGPVAEGDDGDAHPWRGSQIVVVDLADPTRPVEVGRFRLQGEVTDTRIVGDVLYAVSRTAPWYGWYDAEVAAPAGGSAEDTWVLSLDLAEPRSIQVVDEVTFPPTPGWDTHVHVTSERLYLATTGQDVTGAGQTRIQVADISDPGGDIVLGGSLAVPGMLHDRWMLDEAPHPTTGSPVLRVVSQPGWSSDRVDVTTWDPTGAQPRRLGRLEIGLPTTEQITATRFDGDRAYVITYQRVDPLFVVDLTTPEAPRLLGELEMPGWVDHIAPRGDRLVALGHDEDAQGNVVLAVSLFDVTAPAEGTGPWSPTLLQRVSFGDRWGWLPDQRDNYDKVFKVLDDLSLVLVPFHSWGFDESTGYWAHTGGVQLIDLVDPNPTQGRPDPDGVTDDLALRGLIPHTGSIKRALPYQERILTLSDERLQTVDAADRDQPRITATLDLARNVVDFVALDEVGVQLVGDWYLGDTRLLVVPLDDPDLGAPLGEVKITAPYGRMFVHGDRVHLVSQDWQTGRTSVRVVSLADPTRPEVTGELVLPSAGWWGGYRGWWGGDELVAVDGDLLVFHVYRYRSVVMDRAEGGVTYDGGEWDRLYVVDLSDPTAPRLAADLRLDNADWVHGLHARGRTVFFTHYEWDGTDDEGRLTARYFLDRIDLTDPDHPTIHPAVNVPGLVIDLSPDGRVAYTLDYSYGDSWRMRQSINALYLTASRASLLDRFELEGWVQNLAVDDGVMWIHRNLDREVDGRYEVDSSLVSLDLSEPSRLTVMDAQRLPGTWTWLRTVEGGRAFLDADWSGGLLVYDVRDPSAIAFDRFIRANGWIQSLRLQGDTVWLAKGYYGVEGVALATD